MVHRHRDHVVAVQSEASLQLVGEEDIRQLGRAVALLVIVSAWTLNNQINIRLYSSYAVKGTLQVV